MAKINVKLVGVVAGSAGVHYGIQFEAIGKGVLSADKRSFRNITLVARGVDDKIVQSLLDTGKLEKVSDSEVGSLVEKVSTATQVAR